MAIATRQLGNEAQSPIAGQQPPIVGLQAATVNRQSTCRAAKFVRRHVAIVIAAHNHFPAHYDFIDRSKKSAEVRMSDVQRRGMTILFTKTLRQLGHPELEAQTARTNTSRGLTMVFAIERILDYPQVSVFFDSSWIAFSQNP